MNSPHKNSFTVKTFGCKVNQYEGELIRESLLKSGFKESESAVADFFIVNSCTVTAKADKDTRSLIRRFHKTNPAGKIIVAGCMAELDSDRKFLSGMPGVAHLARNTEKSKIAEILTNQSEAKRSLPKGDESIITSFAAHSRAFVKIQDGCDNNCSYCKVSLVRGPSRSRREKEIVKEIKILAEKGIKEMVLTGICLGAWAGEAEGDLVWLLKKVLALKGEFRIRLSSIEPQYLNNELIGLMRDEEKLCRHLHVPLQSGDNDILRLMRRPYDASAFRRIIALSRKQIPGLAFTTDIITGFPGETPKSFLNTVKFIKDVKPSRMHVFSYSKREGTASLDYPGQVDKVRARERTRVLIDLGRDFSRAFAKSMVGNECAVLVENRKQKGKDLPSGYTDNYVRVFIESGNCRENSIVPVKITRVDSHQNTVFGRTK
jgi:threonylcarbamoyladenosine tRNA methylthiotransferase MtaB